MRLCLLSTFVVSLYAQEKQEREDEIEKGNQRLLERLVKAMTTKRVDNWNEVDNRLYVSRQSRYSSCLYYSGVIRVGVTRGDN